MVKKPRPKLGELLTQTQRDWINRKPVKNKDQVKKAVIGKAGNLPEYAKTFLKDIELLIPYFAKGDGALNKLRSLELVLQTHTEKYRETVKPTENVVAFGEPEKVVIDRKGNVIEASDFIKESMRQRWWELHPLPNTNPEKSKKLIDKLIKNYLQGKKRTTLKKREAQLARRYVNGGLIDGPKEGYLLTELGFKILFGDRFVKALRKGEDTQNSK